MKDVKVIRYASGVSGEDGKPKKYVQNKRCFYKGKEYESIKALAKDLKVTARALYMIRSYKGGIFRGHKIEMYNKGKEI